MADRFKDKVTRWLTSPGVMRFVFGFLRQRKPILKLGSYVLVSRKSDVVAVLTDSADFSVEPIYAEAMARTTGPFFLGMDDGPRYQAEVNFARQGALPSDLGVILRDVHKTAAACLAAARLAAHAHQGQIEVVGQFTRKIPLEMVRTYFGVPGESEEKLAVQLRAIFWDLFLNLAGDKAVSAAAIQAANGLRGHLQERIDLQTREIQKGGEPRDFLGRLISRSLAAHGSVDADRVRRTIGGVIVGIVDTISKSMVNVMEELFSRPDSLRSACDAARADREDVLLGYVLEALRFNPHNPILLRKTSRDVTLGAGTAYAVQAAQGTTVVAGTLSAMFDAEHLPNPEAFIPTRPASVYMHFGYGLHTCFGDRISMAVIPAALKHLLRLPGLRPTASDSGIGYAGPFPDRWTLSFDAR